MFKIFRVHEIDLPDHAQVLNRKCIDLFLFQFVHTRAFCQNGDTEISPDQILDRRDIVDLQDHVKIVNAQVLTFQRSGEQVPGIGVRKPQDQFLFFQIIDSNRAFAGQLVLR